MDELLEHDAGDLESAFSDGAPVSPKRRAIVRAATELFLRAGYGAVSMDAIAARAGVSKRTLYRHVSGKDALFGAVICLLGT